MAAYAAVETLIITRDADHHFAEVFTLQQADKRLWQHHQKILLSIQNSKCFFVHLKVRVLFLSSVNLYN